MSSRWSLASLCLVFSVLGYACTPGSDDRPRVTTWEGVKILLKPACIFTPWEAPSTLIPVVHAIAAPVSDSPLHVGLGALKKSQDAYTALSEAKTFGEFYKSCPSEKCPAQDAMLPQYGCLIVVRGTFGAPKAHGQNIAPVAHEAPRWTLDKLKTVGLAKPPALYMELRIKYFGGTPPTHMVLQPVFLDYQATAARKTRALQRKHLLFMFELRTSQPARGVQQLQDQRGPSSGKDRQESTPGDTLAVFSLLLKDVSIGTRVTQEVLSPLSSQVQTLPVAARTARQDNGSMKIVPFTVPFQATLTLAETEHEEAFYWQASEAPADSKAQTSKGGVQTREKGVEGGGK